MKKPITAQFEITENCNLRCPHCYLLENESSNIIKEDVELIDKLTKKIIDLELFNVVVTGGEPLMRKKPLLKCLNELVANNISVSINTNLQLLSLNFLNQLNLKKIRSFLVSCPSSNPDLYFKMTGGGDYYRFLKNLKLLIARTDKVFVNMVVNKNNLNDIRKTASDLKEIGVKKFSATPMAINLLNIRKDIFLSIPEVKKVINDLIWINDSLNMSVDVLEPLPKCIFSKEILKRNFAFLNRKCTAGVNSFTISSKGDVRPCSHNVETYGNILEENFEDIWEKMKNWRLGLYIPSECKNCKMLQFCSGGCRITAKGINGSLNSKDPWMLENLQYSKKDLVKNNASHLVFTKKSTIMFTGDLQFRKEGEDNYLVAVKHRSNTIRVNGSLFKAILYLSKVKKISILDFAQNENIYNSDEFKKVVNFLERKNFVHLLTNPK